MKVNASGTVVNTIGSQACTPKRRRCRQPFPSCPLP
jgi:hypothetical protein